MTALPLPAQLGQMIAGYWTSQAIFVAAKLQIADLLRDGPLSVVALGEQTGTRPELLYRVLRALASVGIFAEQRPGEFGLTPLAELLRRDVPNTQHPLAVMMGEEHYRVWGELLDALRTGENAFEKLYGKPVFDYLADHPEQGRTFDAAMVAIHGRETQAVLDAYDFAGITTLADVGGGNGSKLTAILQRHPRLKGLLYDLPHVVERARPNLVAAGLAERCTLVGGNFFESVPTGADAYLMRHIIHDWNDEQSLTILRHCRRAMPPHGKLLLVESVIPPGNEPFGAKFLDLTMMLIPGGKERTEAEYHTLYEQAGFQLTRIVPTATEISVIEGVPT
jgi:hypothetical protein